MRIRTRTRSHSRSRSPLSTSKTRGKTIAAPRTRSFDEKREAGMGPLRSGNGFSNGGGSNTSKHRTSLMKSEKMSGAISTLDHRDSSSGGGGDGIDGGANESDDYDEDDQNGMSAHLDRVASCVAYSFCSISMVLANKAIASYSDSGSGDAGGGGLPPPASEKEESDLVIHVLPVAFQNLCCVALLEILRALRVVQYERPFRSNGRMLLVLPLSSSFVAMITSGYMCLHHLNVPMVTVFKNVTNLLIVGGEWFFYGEPLTPGIVMSVSIMFFGAVFAALNDLAFTTTGLVWVVINCTTSAAYALYMRRLTSVMSRSTSRPKLLSDSAGHLIRKRKNSNGNHLLNGSGKGDLESSDESVGSIHSGDDLIDDLSPRGMAGSPLNGAGSYHQNDPQQQQLQPQQNSPSNKSDSNQPPAVFDLSRFATVFLNNSISLVLLLTVATISGELSAALAHLGLPTRLDQAIPSSGTTVVFKSASAFSSAGSNSAASASSNSNFFHGFDIAYAALNAFTGSVGFFLNFAQLWCVGATSATTYAIIGSLNKIPITIFGHFIFKTAITRQGQMFVCLNLVGCLIYSYCKIMLKRKKNGIPIDFKAQINSFPSSAGLLRSFPSSVGILYEKKYPA